MPFIDKVEAIKNIAVPITNKLAIIEVCGNKDPKY